MQNMAKSDCIKFKDLIKDVMNKDLRFWNTVMHSVSTISDQPFETQ